jgi:hypothetical protein
MKVLRTFDRFYKTLGEWRMSGYECVSPLNPKTTPINIF